MKCLSIMLLTSVVFASSVKGGTMGWRLQYGSSSMDYVSGISADGLGNIYISGYTNGSLAGPTSGHFEEFLTKYSADGVLLWTRQYGASDYVGSQGISADSLGNVFVAGATGFGSSSGTGTDGFVRKYDDAGNILWTHRLGTSRYDACQGVSIDGVGNVYVTGFTSGILDGSRVGGTDAFVSKYTSDGNLLWTRQFGKRIVDRGLAVSADGIGNVYISGDMWGAMTSLNTEGPPIDEAFVTKFDAAGNFQWSRQLGSEEASEFANISADTLGNVFVSGRQEDPFGGYPNAVLGKYDSTGNLLWTRPLGTANRSDGLSVDGLGNVYCAAQTVGQPGAPDEPNYDVFVSKYDAAGSLFWTSVFGTRGDGVGGVSSDPFGNAYVAGLTVNNFAGPNAGLADVFVLKLVNSNVPEPSNLAIAAIFILNLTSSRYASALLNHSGQSPAVHQKLIFKVGRHPQMSRLVVRG